VNAAVSFVEDQIEAGAFDGGGARCRARNGNSFGAGSAPEFAGRDNLSPAEACGRGPPKPICTELHGFRIARTRGHGARDVLDRGKQRRRG